MKSSAYETEISDHLILLMTNFWSTLSKDKKNFLKNFERSCFHKFLSTIDLDSLIKILPTDVG